jgi:hypothetical protein
LAAEIYQGITGELERVLHGSHHECDFPTCPQFS